MDYSELFDQIDHIIEDELLEIVDSKYDDINDDNIDDDNDDEIDVFLEKIQSGIMLSKSYKKIIHYLGHTEHDYDTIIDYIHDMYSKFPDQIHVENTYGKIGKISKYVFIFTLFINEITQKLYVSLTNKINYLDIEIIINGKLFIRSITYD